MYAAANARECGPNIACPGSRPQAPERRSLRRGSVRGGDVVFATVPAFDRVRRTDLIPHGIALAANVNGVDAARPEVAADFSINQRHDRAGDLRQLLPGAQPGRLAATVARTG